LEASKLVDADRKAVTTREASADASTPNLVAVTKHWCLKMT